MAPHNEEDDPAIYRSSTHKKPKDPLKHADEISNAVASSSKTNGNGNGNGAVHPREHPSDAASPPSSTISEAMDEDSSDGEEEDSTLLTVQPGYNRLLLVLRDERVMRFVKYVSAAAEGSRWDVCGEYEVGVVQEDVDEDGSEDGSHRPS